jgi:transcriptional regulator with XRE-family HTH domain
MADVDPTLLASRLGAAISAARKRRNWSQEVLAERVDVSKNHIGYIERGERIPSLDVAVRIAKALGLSLDCVFLETAKVEEDRAFLDEAGALLSGLTLELRIPILEMLKAANRVHVGERRPSKPGRRGAR